MGKLSGPFIGLTTTLIMLSACGGGGGGEDTPTPPDPPTPTGPTYQTLTGSSTGTSAITALLVRQTTSGANDGDVTTVAQSGTLNHDTSSATLSGITITAVGGSPIAGYDYVETLNVMYSQNGTTYQSTVGLVGITTDTSDLPSTGRVSYSGQATAQITSAGTGVTNATGTSLVDANFGTGQVDVTLNLTTGGAPVDQILIEDMVISGNTFSGGALTTLNTGNSVAFSGSAIDSANGAFFGYDTAASAPDEVGGVFIASGSDGAVIGDFVAD